MPLRRAGEPKEVGGLESTTAPIGFPHRKIVGKNPIGGEMKVTSSIGYLALTGFLWAGVSFAQANGQSVAIKDLTMVQENGKLAQNGPVSEFHHGHHHHHGDHHHHQGDHHHHHHGHHGHHGVTTATDAGAKQAPAPKVKLGE
jgi:hypothetical protein